MDVAAAADGTGATICLEQLWESASGLDLMPSGLLHHDFVFATANHLVATKDLSTGEFAESVSNGAGIDSASTNCDNGACGSQTTTPAAAIAVVDTFHM